MTSVKSYVNESVFNFWAIQVSMSVRTENICEILISVFWCFDSKIHREFEKSMNDSCKAGRRPIFTGISLSQSGSAYAKSDQGNTGFYFSSILKFQN